MNEALPIWVQVGMGLLALAVLFFFGPRALEAAKNSPKGSAQDWLGVLLPIGAVVLFIILLIGLLRS